MKARKLILFFLLIGYGPISKAEQVPPILRKLASVNRSVLVYPISGEPLVDLKDLPQKFKSVGYAIIKTPKDVLLLPQGTGRIYKLETGDSEMSWKRMDSTFFNGYNYGFYAFPWRDKIYSFGGYGFWNFNGNLRHFNETSREWNVNALSESIPWFYDKPQNHASFVYLDTSKGKMTIKCIGREADDALTSSRISKYGNDLYSLDLKTGNWSLMGKFKDTGFSHRAMTPWGLLVDGFSIVDLNNNRYLTISDKFKHVVEGKNNGTTANNEWLMSFCVDSTLYFGNLKDPYDSIQLSVNDWVDTGINVYERPKPSFMLEQLDFKSFLGGILLMGILGVIFYIVSKRKNSRPTIAVATPINTNPPAEEPKTVADPEKQVSFRSSRLLELLETKERSLLIYIFDHSADERFTTIEEINRVIGVSQRSAEVQKRMRSDLIGSINDKLGLISKNKKPVIDKQRSEFDKRTFEYFIRPEHMELVGKVIHGK